MQMTTHTVVLVSTCIVLLCASAAGRAQEPPLTSFTLKPIGPNIWAAIGEPAGQANAGLIIGDDGVAVIDTSVGVDANRALSNRLANQLLAEIRKLTKLPVKFVINTHYHLDHVGGNGVFVDGGATVVAHHNVRGWIRSENLKIIGKDIRPDQKNFVEALGIPAVVYDQALDLYLGSCEIQIRSFPGHTGGDSVVLIPDAKVVFTGDLFWHKVLPNLIDASTKPWIDTLDAFAKMPAGSTFVPGHGDVGSAQDVAAFRDYLATLRKLVGDARAQGKSDQVLSEAVMAALTARFGKWEFFTFLAPMNIADVEAELTGKKKVPLALK